jgi:hypothetical protein
MGAFGFRKPQDLPRTIPVFPLSGAVLFPRGALPLNIFEPRYLNMIDDAMAAERLVGMIQPAMGADQVKPALTPVGCVGRITSFAETDDGRYIITLTGVARFKVGRELDVQSPYRQIEADFLPFGADLTPPPPGFAIDRAGLTAALRRYVDAKGFQVAWDTVEAATPEMLVHAVAALCPFDPTEKQALLEAADLDERCQTLIALLEFNAAADDQERPFQ